MGRFEADLGRSGHQHLSRSGQTREGRRGQTDGAGTDHEHTRPDAHPGTVNRHESRVKAAAAAVDDLPTGDEDIDPKKENTPGRTGDLSAGSKGAPNSGTPPKDEDKEPIVSLHDVIRDKQAASGFF